MASILTIIRDDVAPPYVNFDHLFDEDSPYVTTFEHEFNSCDNKYLFAVYNALHEYVKDVEPIAYDFDQYANTSKHIVLECGDLCKYSDIIHTWMAETYYDTRVIPLISKYLDYLEYDAPVDYDELYADFWKISTHHQYIYLDDNLNYLYELIQSRIYYKSIQYSVASLLCHQIEATVIQFYRQQNAIVSRYLSDSPRHEYDAIVQVFNINRLYDESTYDLLDAYLFRLVTHMFICECLQCK